ncbi:MAG: Cof-type HAD-IIB family hydrolase [Deltaproteobacteria bacterium]|nr:Cof-type HAD-IIB family hydrolase [Deltaproteobacteria bacterium]
MDDKTNDNRKTPQKDDMNDSPTHAPILPEKPAILFFDFDGTIKPAKLEVAPADIDALAELKSQGLTLVAATGRGIFSFRRSCPKGLSPDHLIFSSGLGLCRWTDDGPGPIVFSRRFTVEERDRALAACLEIKRGFYAFEPPPDCHKHVYFDPENFPQTAGYAQRLISYQEFATPYRLGQDLGPRSEFLITAPIAEMPAVKAQFEKICPGLSLLFSSSPFGDPSMWLEILPPGVNKGEAAKRLAQILGVERENCVAIGNDFNDLELLSWAGSAFVTANGAEDLKKLFQTAPSVADNPIRWLGRLLSPRLS